MDKIWRSVAFRLAVICGALVIGSVAVFSMAFYFATVGVMARNADTKIVSVSASMTEDAANRGLDAVARRIESTLTDGVDSDTEILLLTDANGKKIAGNISRWMEVSMPADQILDRDVSRGGGKSPSRVLLHQLPGGATLIVGRDMQDLNEVRVLIGRAVIIGAMLAALLAVGGTLVFRNQLEKRIWAIRQATLDIEAGNLSRRIALSGNRDEFDRLGADINRMLDRIQHLMEGVRHVSNTIAHNLRTPLGLIRGHLEEALRHDPNIRKLEAASHFAIEEIDGLIVVLEKLLQIAEAESGARRQPFEPVALAEVINNLLELYDAAAEAEGVSIAVKIDGDPTVAGDRDLIAGILANLLDNALKYAGSPAKISVSAHERDGQVSLVVQDNGPGIPPQERDNVLAHFYRLDRTKRGNGLGLSIVAAFTQLHGGSLALEDAQPGLRVRLTLPAAHSTTLPNGNSLIA